MGGLFYIYITAAAVAVMVLIVFLLRKYVSHMVDKRISAYQNDLIVKHCDEVQSIYNQMRGWRHDYHNHIQAMKALYALGRNTEINEYLGKLDADLTSVDTVLKTGNVMVDAILNSKISLAASKKIKVTAKATVPQSLAVSEIDLCVVIGNLLDNAIEACMRLDDANGRFIRVYIGVYKELLYISVSNSAGSEIRKTGGSYISSKASPFHGFGLSRIDKIAAKHGGFVNRQNEEGMFAAEIMLPLRNYNN